MNYYEITLKSSNGDWTRTRVNTVSKIHAMKVAKHRANNSSPNGWKPVDCVRAN